MVTGDLPPLRIAPLAKASSDAPDLSIFRYLSDEQPDQLGQFIEKFVAALDQEMKLLTEAVHSGDCERTRRQAHRILSQTALVSASRVAALVTAIQDAARQGDIDTPRSTLAAIEEEVAGLKRDLRSALGTR
jgi:HPt (histidine-containing phosphotransfer) domain-containing protein